MRPPLLVLLILALASASVPSRAAVELSLPLEGFYRPGKYMPIRLAGDLSGEPDPLLLQGDGAISTSLQFDQSRVDGVAPFLPLQNTLRQLHWRQGATQGTSPSSLKALQPDQRLVGYATSDVAFARELFPDQSIIPIRLDFANPLPGPAAAWQTLDALLLDGPSAGQLNSTTLSTLLAGGTLLAIRGDTPPQPDWPWQRHGAHWVLAPALAGPRLAGVYPNAFAPVQGWQAEWPLAFRQRIVLYAVLFAILTLGLTLIRLRWMPLIILLLSIAAVLLLGFWWKNRSAVLVRSGEMMVLGEKLAQADLWHYYASPNAATGLVPWLDLTWPLLEGSADRSAIGLTLHCQGDGRPLSFTCRMPPNLKIGFLSRTVEAVAPAAALAPAETNPLLRLAQRIYLRPGDRILGQLPVQKNTQDSTTAERWPALLIQRTSQP